MFLIFVLLFAYTGCWSLPQTQLPPYPRTQPGYGTYRIALLGDSVTSGINSDYGGGFSFGWADFLLGYGGSPYPQKENKSLFDLWPDSEVANFAIPGSTVYQWSFLRRLQEVLDYQPHLLIIFIGGNDLLAKLKDGVLDSEEKAQIQGHFETMLAHIQASLPETQLLFIGYYDLFDGRSAQLPQPLAHLRGLSEYTLTSNQILETLAQKHDAYYLDLHPLFLHHAYGKDLGDPNFSEEAWVRRPLRSFDIHPNTQGHRAIARAVLGFLKEQAREIR